MISNISKDTEKSKENRSKSTQVLIMYEWEKDKEYSALKFEVALAKFKECNLLQQKSEKIFKKVLQIGRTLTYYCPVKYCSFLNKLKVVDGTQAIEVFKTGKHNHIFELVLNINFRTNLIAKQ
jgi:hypothetical protein